MEIANNKARIQSKFLGFNSEEIALFSQIKRFFERYNGDSQFREQFAADPQQALTDYKLNIDPEDLRYIWKEKFATEIMTDKPAEDSSIAESLKIYREVIRKSKANWQQAKEIAGKIVDPRFKAWRERQIARTKSQFKKVFHDDIIHAPVCFELNKGCSVGCWFCGVSAPRLSDIFAYNPANAQLWQEVLELTKSLMGEAAGMGFCYWATDPMDNPEYEKFCRDFHRILGNFPQTTTALAVRNPERTRQLLQLSQQKGCSSGNRFSVLSKKALDRIHEFFTPEELNFVNLTFQNPESVQFKAVSGRAKQKAENKKKSDSDKFNDQGTIACVSGLLFNMVERSVKLISPCPASEKWPDGYITYDQGTFTDIEDLKQLLERMIDRNMSLTVRPSDLIRFRSDWNYEELPNGFQVSTRMMKRKFVNAPYINRLGTMIVAGDKTAIEIAEQFEDEGIPQVIIFDFLNSLLDKGVLDSEPASEQLNSFSTSKSPLLSVSG